jgi:Rrf2 family protein
MKLSAQEEYGLRCLLHLARRQESATIPEIASAEGLSVPNVAKLMRVLRMGGMVKSVRGQAGGYTLARPAGEVMMIDALQVLGASFFSPTFCDRHAGRNAECAHMTDCSLRAMWSAIHSVVQAVLGKTTLADLLCSEAQMNNWVSERTLSAVPVVERLKTQGPAATTPHSA